MIFWNFVNSLKPHNMKRVLVGEDYYGTKYYEAKPTSTSTRTRPSRSFEPINKDDHTQDLPAEWEAWLRYRRRDPPTLEEIEASYKMAMLKKENAQSLEAKYTKAETKMLDLPAEKRGHQSFPTYKEYENYGRNSEEK